MCTVKATNLLHTLYTIFNNSDFKVRSIWGVANALARAWIQSNVKHLICFTYRITDNCHIASGLPLASSKAALRWGFNIITTCSQEGAKQITHTHTHTHTYTCARTTEKLQHKVAYLTVLSKTCQRHTANGVKKKLYYSRAQRKRALSKRYKESISPYTTKTHILSEHM